MFVTVNYTQHLMNSLWCNNHISCTIHYTHSQTFKFRCRIYRSNRHKKKYVKTENSLIRHFKHKLFVIVVSSPNHLAFVDIVCKHSITLNSKCQLFLKIPIHVHFHWIYLISRNRTFSTTCKYKYRFTQKYSVARTVEPI